MKKPYEAPRYTEGRELLYSDSRGVYIPRDFITEYDPEYYGDLSEYAKDLSDPSNESYWKVWNELLDKVELIDTEGRTWTLEQDGDLFLVCYEILDTNEEE